MGSPEAGAQALAEGTADTPIADKIARDVLRELVAGIMGTWQTLVEVEAAAVQIAGRLDCDDLLHPDVRETLERLKTEVCEHQKSLFRYIPPFALPEADAEAVSELVTIIQRQT